MRKTTAPANPRRPQMAALACVATCAGVGLALPAAAGPALASGPPPSSWGVEAAAVATHVTDSSAKTALQGQPWQASLLAYAGKVRFRGTKSSPAVLDCGLGSPEVRPSELVVACADDNIQGLHLVWSKWGQSGAVARGTYTWNTCVPNCAASKKWDSTVATFTLGQPADTPAGWLFEKLVVKVTGRLPPHMPRTLTLSEKPLPRSR